MRIHTWSNVVATVIGLLISSMAEAKPLPNLHTLQTLLGQVPLPVTVIEPYLSSPEHQIKVVYMGYPARDVLSTVLGSNWTNGDHDIEFTATDGYILRLTTARLEQYPAFMVFARQDGQPFLINNRLQQEPNVALGPYYLVWDNIRYPELLAEGATHWPYQIVEVTQVKSAESVLLPSMLKTSYQAPARLAQDLCLTCHQVNGYGGTKMPINLAARTKQMSEAAFITWVLTPRAVKPNTHMPALSLMLPALQRQTLAKQLYEYFYALPIVP